ncbi:hypothetical protein PHMEG_00021399 [Phytophthora megakarya]|uniref:Reverse transcriptase n=1 Tax=Phytophthora megakarya TaxID=4795 RepID=A0A225VLE3_9STRA|nr:hypothetical protein PHMEG_00021399 [Phytophthora megakarya]
MDKSSWKSVMPRPKNIGYKRGTTIVAASVISDSAFNFENGAPLRQDTDGHPSVAATTEERFDVTRKGDCSEGPSIPDLEVSVNADFSRSNLSEKRMELFQAELDRLNRIVCQEPKVMESEIQQYFDLGFIRKSHSPWASPVLMIGKPDGGIRFCIDFRRFNAVTVKDCYPIPLIDDILDVLGDARLFSTMGIASGYWNVPKH